MCSTRHAACSRCTLLQSAASQLAVVAHALMEVWWLGHTGGGRPDAGRQRLAGVLERDAPQHQVRPAGCCELALGCPCSRLLPRRTALAAAPVEQPPLLPGACRWALLYGTILTNARAMGEFGAVSVISGNILGKTQTLTLFVESAYKVRACRGRVHAGGARVAPCTRLTHMHCDTRAGVQHGGRVRGCGAAVGPGADDALHQGPGGGGRGRGDAQVAAG